MQQTVPPPPPEVGSDVGGGVTAGLGGYVGFFDGWRVDGGFDGLELGCFEGAFVGF